MPVSWWKAFGHTLLHLTYLAISLSASATDDLDLLCIQVPLSLSSAPLVYVSLLLTGISCVIGDRTSPEFQSLVAEQALALSYARSIPTLKYIDVCKEVLSWDRGLTSWWSVVRDSSVSGYELDGVGVQVKALDAYDGKALQNWYDQEA